MISIWFEGAWPDLNSYIRAERSHRQQAAKIKRDYTEAARVIAQAANVGHARTPCEVVCAWHVRDCGEVMVVVGGATCLANR